MPPLTIACPCTDGVSSRLLGWIALEQIQHFERHGDPGLDYVHRKFRRAFDDASHRPLRLNVNLTDRPAHLHVQHRGHKAGGQACDAAHVALGVTRDFALDQIKSASRRDVNGVAASGEFRDCEDAIFHRESGLEAASAGAF